MQRLTDLDTEFAAGVAAALSAVAVAAASVVSAAAAAEPPPQLETTSFPADIVPASFV